MEKVAIKRCHSYNQKEVDKAVSKVINLLDFDFKKGMKVLLKPNIVTANVRNKTAALTQPQVIEAVCKILKKNNCKIFIGESSFMNTDCHFKTFGIEKIAKKYKAKLVVFEQDKLVKIKNPKAKVLKEFPIAKTLKDVDLIINLPKMKTHVLTKYTGAVKNIYGVIPGGLKQRLHRKAQGDEKFSSMLIDVFEKIKPELTIMDGIVGMEGHGPTSGQSVHSNMVLGSRNSIALDIVATKIMKYDPKKIFVIKHAISRKLYSDYKFQLVGLKKLPSIKFEKPKGAKPTSRLRRLFSDKPIVCNKIKCIKCGTCAKKCPVKAITMKPYPVIDKKKCIRCFCCMEICPVDALRLKP